MDDAYDYFMAEGIYAKGFWDGHQHHVAGECITTNELCMRVKGILDRSTLLMYLDGVNDVILRYFIAWFTLEENDMPFHVWPDRVEGQRKFFYEKFSGSVQELNLKDRVTKESLGSTQTSIDVEESDKTYVTMRTCQMGSCTEGVVDTITLKSGMSLDVCAIHSKKVSEQVSDIKKSKAVKAAERKKANKNNPKKKKMTAEEAAKILKSREAL